MWLFGGQLWEGNPPLADTPYARGGLWPVHFNDVASAFVAMWCLLLVNDWWVIDHGGGGGGGGY